MRRSKRRRLSPSKHGLAPSLRTATEAMAAEDEVKELEIRGYAWAPPLDRGVGICAAKRQLRGSSTRAAWRFRQSEHAVSGPRSWDRAC